MTQLINSHVAGFLMVMISIAIQVIIWVLVFQSISTTILKILFVLMFPVYFVITSFFTFYSVNLVYNIFVPPRWIEQNSKYLSYNPPFQIKSNPLEKPTTVSVDQITNMSDHSDHSVNSFNSLDLSNSFTIKKQIEEFCDMSESARSMRVSSSESSKNSHSSNSKQTNFTISSYKLNGDIEMGNVNTNWQEYERLYKSKSCDDVHVKVNKFDEKMLKSKSLSPKKSCDICVRQLCEEQKTTVESTSIEHILLDDVQTSSNNDTRPVILTVQIPVYTEDFRETLVHTFENIKTFVEIWNQEHTDSKVNVLIHEDGLQKVNENEKNIRIDYYEKFEDSFYIARQVEGRAGRFKKASNMNFGMRQILKINRSENFDREQEWLRLSHELNFMYKVSSAPTFEIGKYILLIDSDSRFNPHAISALIHEMEMSPNVGYLQVRTVPNKVIKSTWENAISHFTKAIYSINFLYSCSNGFPAPLVGHNVVLRWEALQNVEKLMNGYGNRSLDSWELWDEGRVSEDFVMSIYLQYLGYYGKYVFYDCGFKEGVSLNIVDEITKLKKYIYGVNEIMFYPCRKWYTEGITTHLYGNFLLSEKITFSTKYALLSYMGSYYSLAFSPLVTAWYYFVKFFKVTNSEIFVNDSLNTIFACAFIFFGMSVLTNILVKAKHKFIKRTFYELVIKEILYGLYLTIFYSCVSWHLLTMMSSYFLNFPAKWETTKKEAEKLPITTLIWTYKWMYFFGTGLLVLILYGIGSNGDYQNKDPKSVVPFLIMILSHLLLPIYTVMT